MFRQTNIFRALCLLGVILLNIDGIDGKGRRQPTSSRVSRSNVKKNAAPFTLPVTSLAPLYPEGDFIGGLPSIPLNFIDSNKQLAFDDALNAMELSEMQQQSHFDSEFAAPTTVTPTTMETDADALDSVETLRFDFTRWAARESQSKNTMDQSKLPFVNREIVMKCPGGNCFP